MTKKLIQVFDGNSLRLTILLVYTVFNCDTTGLVKEKMTQRSCGKIICKLISDFSELNEFTKTLYEEDFFQDVLVAN